MRAHLASIVALALVLTDVPAWGDLHLFTKPPNSACCHYFRQEALSVAALWGAEPVLLSARKRATILYRRLINSALTEANPASATLPSDPPVLREDLRRPRVWEQWPKLTQLTTALIAGAVLMAVMKGGHGIVALMTAPLVIAAIRMGSGNPNPIPWDQELVDKTIQEISEPKPKLVSLAYKAMALGKLGHREAAWAVAQAARRLLKQLEVTAPGLFDFTGPVLRRDVALAFEWAQDRKSADELVASMRNAYWKSETIAGQAQIRAETGDLAGARQAFDTALETLKGAKGAMLGEIDLEPEYAAIDHELHKAVLKASDATYTVLVKIAGCQYAAGFTEDAHKTSDAVIVFLMDRAAQGDKDYDPYHVADGLSRLLIKLPGDRWVIEKIEGIARNFQHAGSGLEWEDGVDEGLVQLWASVGYGWAKAGESDPARQAFQEARQVLNRMGPTGGLTIYSLWILVNLQIETGFSKEAGADMVEFMVRAAPEVEYLDRDDRARLAETLIRLGDFHWAEYICWGPFRRIEPDNMATVAVLAGNVAKAFEYAHMDKREPAYSEVLDDLVRAVIGPLDRLKTSRPAAPSGGGAGLMSLVLLAASMATIGSTPHIPGVYRSGSLTPLAGGSQRPLFQAT